MRRRLEILSARHGARAGSQIPVNEALHTNELERVTCSEVGYGQSGNTGSKLLFPSRLVRSTLPETMLRWLKLHHAEADLWVCGNLVRNTAERSAPVEQRGD